MTSRKLYEIIGVACGLVLINFGFSIISAGMPGTRQLTSQFLGVNLLIGGCVIMFLSLYYFLKPIAKVAPTIQSETGRPDVGVEIVVVEKTPAQVGFYRNIEYIGYFFTALGLFSAADLALQVFIPQIYNETRWWIEILLVVFGVLSYAIFFSIGRIGSQEEKGYVPSTQAGIAQTEVAEEKMPAPPGAMVLPESFELRVGEFTGTASGEYEKHLLGNVYDMFRLEKDSVTVWRENRVGIRSVYLAGPYELSSEQIQDCLNRGQSLKIGNLSVPTDALKDLVNLQRRAEEGISASST